VQQDETISLRTAVQIMIAVHDTKTAKKKNRKIEKPSRGNRAKLRMRAVQRTVIGCAGMFGVCLPLSLLHAAGNWEQRGLSLLAQLAVVQRADMGRQFGLLRAPLSHPTALSVCLHVCRPLLSPHLRHAVCQLPCLAMLHLLNCLLLAFAPHVVIYKATKLSEENGLRACVFAAFGYAATQIVKIFVMASLLPTSGEEVLVTASGASEAVPREFGLISEIAKCLISLVVEVAGVQTVLQLTPSLSKFSVGTRVLAIALGMALSDSLLKYALPLFWGARAAEFSWNNIEMALASNVSLLLHLAFVAAVWLRTRTDLSKAALPLIYAIIATSAVMPSVEKSACTGTRSRQAE